VDSCGWGIGAECCRICERDRRWRNDGDGGGRGGRRREDRGELGAGGRLDGGWKTECRVERKAGGDTHRRGRT
jgi:hypothetical protein